MKKKIAVIGLTGGIGSGKSTIAKIFSDKGIPVYIADIEAKKIMVNDEELKRAIVELLGNESYNELGELNREYIAGKVFNNKSLLAKLNSIVHPAVSKHFKNWKTKQSSLYVIKEVAILFENDSYKKCDYTILITAPVDVRIERVIKRDKTDKEQVLSRMKNQWTDEKKIPLSDFVLENVDMELISGHVERVHNEIVTLLSLK